MVYIAEAHASDVWQLPANIKDDVVFASPKSLDERYGLAQACVRDLGIEFPAVVDDFANSTEAAYTGWPDRLYVIDQNGKVAYKSAPGPYGFEPGGVEETLTKLLGPDSQANANLAID